MLDGLTKIFKNLYIYNSADNSESESDEEEQQEDDDNAVENNALLQNEILQLNRQLTALTQQLDKANRDRVQLRQQNTELQETLTAVKEDRNNLRKKMPDVSSQESQQNTILILRQQLESANTDRTLLRQENLQLRDNLSAVKEDRDNLRCQINPDSDTDMPNSQERRSSPYSFTY